LEQGEDIHDHEDYENVVSGEISTKDATVSSGAPNVQELEMLLGAYFVQIGATLNKLAAVRTQS
jgi:hypothetical protein